MNISSNGEHSLEELFEVLKKMSEEKDLDIRVVGPGAPPKEVLDMIKKINEKRLTRGKPAEGVMGESFAKVDSTKPRSSKTDPLDELTGILNQLTGIADRMQEENEEEDDLSNDEAQRLAIQAFVMDVLNKYRELGFTFPVSVFAAEVAKIATCTELALDEDVYGDAEKVFMGTKAELENDKDLLKKFPFPEVSKVGVNAGNRIFGLLKGNSKLSFLDRELALATAFLNNVEDHLLNDN